MFFYNFEKCLWQGWEESHEYCKTGFENIRYQTIASDKVAEINNGSRGEKIDSQIRFKRRMLRSVLCYYRDTYIFVKGTAKVTGTGDIAGTSSAYLTGKNL